MVPFHFTILNSEIKNEKFQVSEDRAKNLIEVFEESAKLFFYTQEGFKTSWPLTFHLYDENSVLISKADIFVLAASPKFDIIPFFLNSSSDFSHFYY